MTAFINFFAPRSLAFLGASSDARKWGFRILSNIISGGYKGRIYPVNPKGGQIDHLTFYKSLQDVPEEPDLAVIVVPSTGILQAIKECGQKHIKAGVIITAGFAEVDDKGSLLQTEIVETARMNGMRLIGPNCFGLMSTPGKLYAQMPAIFPSAGAIAVVSQSGNVGFTIASNAMAMNFGCSRVISTGNEADLHAEDFIEYLADDSQTKVIMGYVEGFKDGRRFFDIAKHSSLKKPIVMIKVGETEAGAAAARSHTASLSGSDQVFNGICQQAGIIRVYNLQELMNVGYGFLCHPLPRGKKVGIVTLGGGWGVLAADACAKFGLEVVKLSDEVMKKLDAILPPWWSRNNPVDMVAGLPPDEMPRIIEILAQYEKTDAVIALGLPSDDILHSDFDSDAPDYEQRINTAIGRLLKSFEKVKQISERYSKPVIFAAEVAPLANGDVSHIHKAMRALASRNAICYTMPDEAAMVLSSMVKYSQYLQSRILN